MKKIILFLLIAISSKAFAQQPLQWSITATKTAGQEYELKLDINIAAGWHLYSATDTALGLEAFSITWEDETILKETASLPPSIRFKDPLFDNKEVKIISSGRFSLSQKIRTGAVVPATLKVSFKGYLSNNEEFLPVEEAKEVKLEGGVEQDNSDKLKMVAVDINNPATDCGKKKQSGLFTIFMIGFAAGFFALLTPCVFPMVPVTVSYFTNRSATKRQGIRNGLLYGLFIFFIYILVSSPFHLLNLDPQILNTISTNAWVNVAFFAIFIYFALSFFGLYEIGLGSKAANKAGAKSSIASLGGIFFMALTLTIVSFSCTGPILGMLLVGSLNGGAWQLTAGMGGFGLALALPFALFAIFPGLLKSLPKSGGWMEVVKKSLAFIELALAFKFLSNADLVEHWGLLKREVFIAIWMIIALFLSLYLLGVFSKPERKPAGMYVADKPPVVAAGPIFTVRRIIGLMFLAFALYLIPGLGTSASANLKLLSGFAPPLSYSVYGKKNIIGKGVEPNVINDYEKALQIVKQQNKPLLIDFTGWACVNCRKMEENVWTEPEVKKIIEDNYILVSLYVDDREMLPREKRFTYKYNGGEKEIRTVGNKWATMQAVNFTEATQPLHVVLSPGEKLLNHPVGYTPKVKKYKEWLNCGVNAFRNLKK